MGPPTNQKQNRTKKNQETKGVTKESKPTTEDGTEGKPDGADIQGLSAICMWDYCEHLSSASRFHQPANPAELVIRL